MTASREWRPSLRPKKSNGGSDDNPSPGPLIAGAGNQQLLHALGMRAKPTASQPSDPAEAEADRVADAFASRAQIARQCTACEQDEGTIRRKPLAGRPAADASAVLPGLDASSGQPLPSPLRRDYERFFDADLSSVRVHTGASAADASRSVQALAFTLGRDIYFGSGQYQPGSDGGRRLLTHELTHVVQQGVSGRADSRAPGAALSAHPTAAIQRQSIHNPLFPCYETSLIPGGMEFFGTLVHLAIQQHFVSNIDPLAATEYVIPGSGPRGGLGRADIVSSIGGIYEVKPVGLAVEGFLEAVAYLAQAEVHCDPLVPWHLGMLYWAPPLTVGDFTVISWLEGPGLILYTLRRRQTEPRRVPEPITEPVPVPAPQPQSHWEKIAEWARRVYEEGLDATRAAEEFLRANPELAGVIAAAGIVAIIVLIADDATIAGIVDDILIPIIAALEWVALRMAFAF